MMDKNIKKYQNLSDFSLRKQFRNKDQQFSSIITLCNYFIIFNIIKYN